MNTPNTDRIEKQVLLNAPVQRVWQALADAREFGSWFGVKFTDRFTPGVPIKGHVTHKGYEHIVMSVTIERMEPEKLLSWRWHPHAIDPKRDYSAEVPTLVEFELCEVNGGTLLKVTESGFDRVPAERRAEAFRGNEQGWTIQMQAIQNHVDRTQ